MTILHNFIDDSTDRDYNESNRKVLLHQHATNYDTAFTVAAMTTGYVQITRLDEDRKPKTMRLTSVEMEALIAAWAAFKADIEAAKATKIAQQQNDLQSALSLAREMREHLGELGTTEIIVNNADYGHDHNTYKVSLPSLGWNYHSYHHTGYTIHTGTVLLEAVREALGHIKTEIDIYKTSPARQTWTGEFKEKTEGYIATWDAAEAWLEQVKAEHFPKTEEETVPATNAVAWTVPAGGQETTWTLHLTNTAQQ